jgi:hypothetical protein
MPGDELKERVAAIESEAGSHAEAIGKLIRDGFFDSPVSSEEVARRVSDRSGRRLKTIHVQTYIKKFQQTEILHAIKAPGIKGNFWVVTSVLRADALRQIGKTKKVMALEAELFSPSLTKTLEKRCPAELVELRDNFGRHGNCTAFLLRKILEKMLIITFAKNGKEDLLEDAARPGGWKGLKDMLETAAREKYDGVPFLTGKTKNKVEGVKFLGDTAAHNPRATVAMETIVPQMPFIITAYEELAALL